MLPTQSVEFIDAYCERAEPGLWSEPVNVLTNLGFVVVGLFLLRRMAHQPSFRARSKWDLWLLVACLFLIGSGSALWHLYAAPWAQLADILPITLLINMFLVSFLLRAARLQTWQIVGLLLGFHIFNFWLIKPFPEDFLNGSIFYVPIWATLWAIVIYLYKSHRPIANSFLTATLIFTVSIALRSYDLEVCKYFPVGTHFLWHLLNAVVLYILVGGLISQAHSNDSASSQQ